MSGANTLFSMMNQMGSGLGNRDRGGFAAPRQLAASATDTVTGRDFQIAFCRHRRGGNDRIPGFSAGSHPMPPTPLRQARSLIL